MAKRVLGVYLFSLLVADSAALAPSNASVWLVRIDCGKIGIKWSTPQSGDFEDAYFASATLQPDFAQVDTESVVESGSKIYALVSPLIVTPGEAYVVRLWGDVEYCFTAPLCAVPTRANIVDKVVFTGNVGSNGRSRLVFTALQGELEDARSVSLILGGSSTYPNGDPNAAWREFHVSLGRCFVFSL